MTTNDMLVVVPSRGRPENMRELTKTFYDTRTHAGTRLGVMVDADDPELPVYQDECLWPTLFEWARNTSMNDALNRFLAIMASNGTLDRVDQIGFMGDDHRPRTRGWDEIVIENLRHMGTGIVYGNDLFQEQNLPTAVFMTSNIVKALGYMAPPCLSHLELDSYWLALGRGADCVRYLDDVIIEHLHPEAGKAEYDEGYARMNALRERDKIAWEKFKDDGFLARDIEIVKALRA